MRLALEIAADPLLKLAEAQDDIASLCLSSDNSNAGGVRSYITRFWRRRSCRRGRCLRRGA